MSLSSIKNTSENLSQISSETAINEHNFIQVMGATANKYAKTPSLEFLNVLLPYTGDKNILSLFEKTQNDLESSGKARDVTGETIFRTTVEKYLSDHEIKGLFGQGYPLEGIDKGITEQLMSDFGELVDGLPSVQPSFEEFVKGLPKVPGEK
ncbi:hypothetical protein SG34_004590 [Thalassomonas viridans]|uniref:Uncharacterized protein n=1 Tax=Thalassomonas viridans TaxID=137584 RepID=A0AAE9Z428_9GAMM|nr:hypothetical protein [Thalassomonas viridans]WDE06213.1 hypothetical protein SG34_004590 [Thalassomonas viridans]